MPNEENELQALQLFNKVSASTQKLADAIRKHFEGVTVHVMPDSVPKSLVSIHLARQTHLQPRSRNSLAYIQAPNEIGLAFRQIWDVVYKVLSENEDVTLTAFGDLDAPDALRLHPKVRVEPALLQPYRISAYAKFDCILAPSLSRDRERCNSRADYVEATLAGCRYISAPLPDYPSLRQPNLKIAPHPAEWYEHLCDSIDKPLKRKDMLACFERTIHTRSSKRFIGDYLKFLAAP